jgi:hypothetical protein
MYVTHRPKIVHRPTRAASQNGVESSEAQYEREQEYWRHKQQKHKEVHDRLHGSLYPTQEDKLKKQQEMQVVMEEQLRSKEQGNRCAIVGFYSIASWSNLHLGEEIIPPVAGMVEMRIMTGESLVTVGKHHRRCNP